MSKKEDREFALGKLRTMLRPGAAVATVVQHRATVTYVRVLISGGLFPGYAGPSDISPLVTIALGRRAGRTHKGVPTTEVGTDDEACVVLDLERALFRGGWDCIGPGCPSAEHAGPSPAEVPDPPWRHHDTRALNHNRLG
jgi:hypothetical protein